MKEQTEITITTTHYDGDQTTTTVKSNGLDAQVIYDLMERAFLGHGFHPDTVKEYFPNE